MSKDADLCAKLHVRADHIHPSLDSDLEREAVASIVALTKERDNAIAAAASCDAMTAKTRANNLALEARVAELEADAARALALLRNWCDVCAYADPAALKSAISDAYTRTTKYIAARAAPTRGDKDAD